LIAESRSPDTSSASNHPQGQSSASLKLTEQIITDLLCCLNVSKGISHIITG
jgi:hypothetical protein